MRSGERGFTYVWVMALVAVLGIGLAAIGPLWSDDARRERERELLRIGQLYAQAIARYYQASPGSVKRYPPSLESLVLDTRFVGTMRHLRKLYADPVDPSRPWGVVRAPDGGVRGVHSQSDKAPLRTEALDLGITLLPAARTYSDWQFVPKVDS
jgi:type II secretory pathway pseudopilin PulG